MDPLPREESSRFRAGSKRITSLREWKDFVVVVKVSEWKCRSRCRNRLCAGQLAYRRCRHVKYVPEGSWPHPGCESRGCIYIYIYVSKRARGMKPDYYFARRMEVISAESFGLDVSQKYSRLYIICKLCGERGTRWRRLSNEPVNLLLIFEKYDFARNVPK